jgi:5'-methylthioadenosine phosphorylase
MKKTNKIKLGVLGGTGIYKMDSLEQIETIAVETPFGSPSSQITIGLLEGVKVGFIARHGLGHAITPTEVNYRANVYALKSLGAERVLSISACGSLREDYAPGEIVIPNQLVDFTKLRQTSYFGDGLVAHIGVADPFCPQFSATVFKAAKDTGVPAKFRGTAVTIEGPRFSTKAESQLFRSWGIDLIGMTTAPEAFLAREAELCYSVVFHVTDYDVWHQDEEPVSVEQVFEILKQNTSQAQDVIRAVARSYNPHRSCACPTALKDAFATSAPSDETTLQKLSLLLENYPKFK